MPAIKPLLIVLSGPSGAGKDVAIRELKKLEITLVHITTVTTRPPRHGEKTGVDYHFVSIEEFKHLMESGGLLEQANVYGNWYGVPKFPIWQALKEGKDVIVKVDVQGAATIKKIATEAVFIFLTPPSLKELEERLKNRDTESSEDLHIRLTKVREEMAKIPDFDYVVINSRDNLEKAVSAIRSIIIAERCRAVPRIVSLD
ncbi:guanylate kinase [Chloroflexota bacterium]